MNCAIAPKGSEKIRYFLLDCTVRDEAHYVGSNMDLRPVSPSRMEVRWTFDVANELPDGNYDKTMSELTPAPVYEGIVVGSATDVDGVTRDLIAAKYSPSDEAKIHRLRLAGEEDYPGQFEEYNTALKAIRAAGRAFKDEYFPEGTALTDAKG